MCELLDFLMKLRHLLGFATLIAVTCPYQASAVIYSIPAQTNLVTVAFRGESNTTYFGWNDGQFFGQPVPSSGSRILNNLAVSFGNVDTLNGVQFYQNDRSASPFVLIGSSGGNIYTGIGAIGKQAAATLVAPGAPAVPDSGFTTIVIQGRTTTAGGFSTLDLLISNYPVFSSINGVSPSFVISGNASNQGQWWAQYNIPGGSSSYTIGMTFPGGSNTTPISIAGMSVDTYWSAAGYANVGAVPEPSSLALIGCGIALIGARLWQRRAHGKKTP